MDRESILKEYTYLIPSDRLDLKRARQFTAGVYLSRWDGAPCSLVDSQCNPADVQFFSLASAHPNCSRFYGITRCEWDCGPKYMLVFEGRGNSLLDELKRQRLSQSCIIRIALCVIRGLIHLKNLDKRDMVSHRSCRPDTIYLRSKREAFLTDYHLHSPEGENFNIANGIQYMAPEVIDNPKCTIKDLNANFIWGFGVFLSEICTGRYTPLMGDLSAMKKLQELTSGKPIPVPEKCSIVLRRIIELCTTHNKEYRLQHASLETIEKILSKAL